MSLERAEEIVALCSGWTGVTSSCALERLPKVAVRGCDDLFGDAAAFGLTYSEAAGVMDGWDMSAGYGAIFQRSLEEGLPICVGWESGENFGGIYERLQPAEYAEGYKLGERAYRSCEHPLAPIDDETY